MDKMALCLGSKFPAKNEDVKSEDLSHDTFASDMDKSEMENDVVISGISCRLPSCNNMAEFRDNLLSAVDMTDSVDNNDHGSVMWNGMQNTDKFDAAYFCLKVKEANCMDPQLRMLLEVSTEAIIDAGLVPSSLCEGRVGVYIGVGPSHAEEAWCTNPDSLNHYPTTGNSKHTIASKMSQLLALKGPSYCIQGSDAASGVALDRAYQDILMGETDSALVAGSSLSFKPASVLKYCQQGLMSETFISRPFDAHADGFVGGDGIVAMLLQFKTDAKRIYASILHCKSIITPTEHPGLSYASTVNQAEFLQEVYSEADIDPKFVEYIELHATGVPDYDMEEMEAVTSALCSDRMSPLLIGSVKSNAGHTLATSGLVSIAKLLVSFEEGMIPANRNMSHVSDNILQLHDGKMQVVTENTRPFVRLFGMNSLGFGGYHTHCILDGNQKQRMLHYMASRMPRLCIYSGRTENGVKKALKFLHDHRENIELQALSNETANISPLKMPYRGFCLLNSDEKVFKIQQCSSRTVNRPVWFVFSGMGTQWPGMGRKMMQLDTFKCSILESSEVLHQYGVNLYKLIMEGADNSFERPLNSFIVITAIQIALVKLLREMGIVADGVIGHSSGEIACGYANGCLTACEAILAAYWEGFCIQELDPLPGAMAAVGLSWKEALRQCPKDVVAACHNAENTVTVSGPVDQVHEFVQQMKDLGIFTREVKSVGVAFHSPAIKDVVPLLQEYLSKLIEPKPKTSAWISTSVPEDLWNSELNKTCSVDYLVNNLTSPVLFQEALKHIPADSIVLEIGPHNLLQTILKRSLDKDIFHIGLMKRHHTNNVAFFFKALGKCYVEGLDLNPLGIFPPVDFPVPRGTPSLSSLIEWDHCDTLNIPQPGDFLGGTHGQWSEWRFSFDTRHDGKDCQLTGHVINGDCVFPVAGYVIIIWKSVAKYFGKVHQDISITIKDMKIHEQVKISETGCFVLDVSFIPMLGKFEITDSGRLVASGNISSGGQQYLHDQDMDYIEQTMELSQEDIYHELEMRGYNYTGKFQSLTKLNVNGEAGCLEWCGDWMTYLDGIIQLVMLDNPTRSLLLPVEIKSLTIIPEHHRKIIQQNFGSVTLDKDIHSVISGGFCISGMKTESVPYIKQESSMIDTVQFIPFQEVVSSDQCGLENHMKYGEMCAKLATQYLMNLIQQEHKLGAAIPYKAQLEHYLVKLQKENRTDSHCSTNRDLNGSVRKYIEELMSIPVDGNYFDNARSLRQDFESSINNDHVYNCLDSIRAVKPCIDIITENVSHSTLRILQVCGYKSLLLGPTLQCLKTSKIASYVSGDVKVNGCKHLDWTINMKLPQSVQLFDLIVLDKILSKESDVASSLTNVVDALEDGGFILVKEYTQDFQLVYTLGMIGEDETKRIDTRTCGPWMDEDRWGELFVGHGLHVISKKKDGEMSTLFLLRKLSNELKSRAFPSEASDFDIDLIDATSVESAWFEGLTKKIESTLDNTDRSPVVCVTDDCCNGITGLVEYWQKNPNKRKIRFVHLEDESKELCRNNLKTSSIFQRQCQNNLITNIYRNGQWGNYHYIPIDKVMMEEVQSTSVFVKGIGVPSTPKLVTMNIDKAVNRVDDTDLVTCYPRFCLVSRDSVSAVKGSQETDMINKFQRLTLHKKLGINYSGYDDNGRRIMGISTDICPATKLEAEKYLTWDIPESWSLEEACSVPSAYLLAYYSLFVCAGLRKDQTLLVTGNSDVSIAAATIATHQCACVFASSELINMMAHTGTKHDVKTSLHLYTELEDVFRLTKGIGVDTILNSCTDPTFTVSHLLKSGGHMINLDTYKKHVFTTDTGLMQKKCTVSSLTMDNLNEDDIRHVSQLMSRGLKSGHIKAFQSVVYGSGKLQEAYEYKASNMDDKVVIKFGEDSHKGPVTETALRILTCSAQKCYIIIYGRRKFGLVLTDWLIEHGATKILLVSTTNTHTGYEKRKLRQWYTLGITVNIYHSDKQHSLDHTQILINEAKKIGPVGGLFYFPMIDDRGTSLSSICLSSTSYARHLDTVTRTSCNKTLDWFVVMPVNCTSEHIDQSAHSFVTTALQRIVDYRRVNGFPGLCVSLARTDCSNNLIDTKTTLIVLNSLDMLLQQCHPVVQLTLKDVCIPDNMVETGAHNDQLFDKMSELLGISDISRTKDCVLVKDVCVDDNTVDNIKGLLDTAVDVSYTCDGIKTLTLGELWNICRSKDDGNVQENIIVDTSETSNHVIQGLEDYGTCIIKLNEIVNKHIPIYMVFDEDDFEDITLLAGLIDSPVYGVRKSCTDVPMESIKCQAGYLIQNLYVNNNCGPLILIGYRMGCVVAIEMALQLQESDLDVVKHIVCIEGSIEYVPLSDAQCFYKKEFETLEEVDKEMVALKAYIELYVHPSDQLQEVVHGIEPYLPIDMKVASLVPDLLSSYQSQNTILSQTTAQCRLLYHVLSYMLTVQYDNCGKYKRNITLIRGRGRPNDIKTSSDYYLSKVCEKGVSVHILNTGHTNFLRKMKVEISHTLNALLHKVMSSQT